MKSWIKPPKPSRKLSEIGGDALLLMRTVILDYARWMITRPDAGRGIKSFGLEYTAESIESLVDAGLIRFHLDEGGSISPMIWDPYAGRYCAEGDEMTSPPVEDCISIPDDMLADYSAEVAFVVVMCYYGKSLRGAKDRKKGVQEAINEGMLTKKHHKLRLTAKALAYFEGDMDE